MKVRDDTKKKNRTNVQYKEYQTYTKGIATNFKNQYEELDSF